MTHHDPLMSARAVREELGDVTDMTIWRWIKSGILPAPIKINNRNYWPRSAIEPIKAGARGAA